MSDEIISEAELVDIDLLKPNKYNPNEMSEEQFQYLIDDLKENGFVGQPIIATEKHEIIDGQHRWEAAKFLGFEKVPVVIFNPFDEDHQKILTIGWNSKRGELNPSKLAKIIIDLNQKYSLEELSSKLGFSQENLKDKLSLSSVTSEFMEEIKKQAEEKQNEIPSVITFALTKEQEMIVNQALELADGKTKGNKLYYICIEYLGGNSYVKKDE
jgi:ParB family transcriptional regulator, chromosome partitioning protein